MPVRYPQGGRDSFSVTCSYVRLDDVRRITRNGWGDSFDDAIRDANSRLPVGEWRILSISNPNSVYSDLKNAGAIRGATSNGSRSKKYEGISIVVTDSLYA